MNDKDLENEKDQPSARALQGVKRGRVWGGEHEGVEALVQIFDLVTGLVQKIPKRPTERKVDWLNLTARASLRSPPQELELI